MCKAWDDHKKRDIQEGRYLEIYSLVQDGIIEPELGAKRLNMTFADFERAMQKECVKLFSKWMYEKKIAFLFDLRYNNNVNLG
mgnify:FL=1